MDAQCRELFHDLHMRSICQRMGYALTTVAVFQIMEGTLLIKRFHANRFRWAFDGMEPFFLAFFFAILRRSLTMDSGIRTATRRDGTNSFAPRTMSLSMRLPSTAWSIWVSSMCCSPPALGAKMVV